MNVHICNSSNKKSQLHNLIIKHESTFCFMWQSEIEFTFFHISVIKLTQDMLLLFPSVVCCVRFSLSFPKSQQSIFLISSHERERVPTHYPRFFYHVFIFFFSVFFPFSLNDIFKVQRQTL